MTLLARIQSARAEREPAPTGPCPFCHCATRGKHTATRKRSSVAYLGSCEIGERRCWKWDHYHADQWPRGGRTVRATYAPATLAGKVVPQATIEAVQ